MNDNTSYREKGRAVFLAAIMVLSVVAMSAAFAGSAAALDQSDDDVTDAIASNIVFDDSEAEQGFSITVDADSSTFQDEGHTATFYINSSDLEDAYDGADVSAAIVGGADAANATIDDAWSIGENDGLAGVTIESTDEDGNLEDVVVAVSVEDVDTENVAPGEISDIEVTDSDGTQLETADAIQAVYAQNVQTFDDGDRAWSGSERMITNASETNDDGQIDTNGDGLAEFDEAELRSLNDDREIAGLESELSIGSHEGERYVEVETDGLETGEYAIVFDGEMETGQEIGDRSDWANNPALLIEVTEQSFDAEWEEDEYDNTDTDAELEFDTNRNNYNVQISGDNLDDDDLVALFGHNDAPDTTFGDQPWYGQDIDDDVITLSGAGDVVTANFADAELDPDEYEFEIEVTDATAEASASVDVAEEDVDADFDQGVYTQSAGDLLNVELDLEDTDEAYVQFGDEDAGFVDVLHVEDGDDSGSVDVWVNTRLVGVVGAPAYTSGDDEVSSMYMDWTDLPDELEDASFYDEDEHEADGATGFTFFTNELNDEDPGDQLVRPLQPTDYSLTAGADGVFIVDDGESEHDDEIAAATLDLTSPEIGEINTHVAPQDDADEDELAELLGEDVTLTERTDIAEDDRLIIEVQASGLYGALLAEQSHDPGDLEDGFTAETLYEVFDGDDWEGEGINFDVVGEDAVGNQDPTELNLEEAEDDEIYAFADNTNGALYVVVDTGASGAWDGSIDDGDTFDVEFEYETHDDDRFRFDEAPVGSSSWNGGADNGDAAYPYFGADSDQSVSTEFTIVEPAAWFDNLDADDYVQIETSEDATVSGETNVAPGSEVDIRITNAGDTPSFLTTPDAEIDSDGTFESEEVDFSDRAEGDEAELDYRVYGSSIDDADGIFVEAVDDEDDDAPEEDDDAPEEDDEPPETDDEPPETDDDPEPPADDTADDVEPEDDGVPGFGLAIAVVALLAAAMLALRRQN